MLDRTNSQSILKIREVHVIPRLFMLGLGVVLALTAAAHAQTPPKPSAFFKAIDDLPLAPDLVETPDPVIFESDQGRVVRTYAEGKASCEAASKFYAETLPALGWELTDDKVQLYKRENEQLRLVIVCLISGRGETIVEFELVVKLASTKLPE